MFVEITVEKGHRIFVTDSTGDASTLCTGAGAGTFWVEPSGLIVFTTEAQRHGVRPLALFSRSGFCQLVEKRIET